MSDLIHDDYRLLQVISRFGISLGFGDQSSVTVTQQLNPDVAGWPALTEKWLMV